MVQDISKQNKTGDRMPTGTPRGFRDILPSEALDRERITSKVRSSFSQHGYLPVETPLLEYRDVLERGSRIADSPFQLFDTDDALLVMRPDLTLPIARLVSTRLATAHLPLRLRYEAPVVREESQLRGQPRQFTQLGVELIGNDGLSSEREVVQLLGETLDGLGAAAWRIVCGSVVPMNALLETCVGDAALVERIRACVHSSNFVLLDSCVNKALEQGHISPAAARALCELPRLAGGAEIIETIDSLLCEAGVPEETRGTSELRNLISEHSEFISDGRLTFDFSIINSFDYYTGSIFKAYADGVAAPLASGGRYDVVLDKLGMPDVSACGFALSLERLQEMLGKPGISGVVVAGGPASERPLRIAIPKGALFEPTLSLLEHAGLPTEGLREHDRKLVVRIGDVEYIIVRASDAPSFVAYGGADCGICGNDSLIETHADLLELVDLNFGRCHFVVAEPKSAVGKAERAYSWRGTLRVATKYPRITQAYFDRIGKQVDIVSLHGNIELGPIVGMTDRIVDITQTGTTLRENNLVVVDDNVLECSARFFAGPAAWRCDPRIRKLSTKLRLAAQDRTRREEQ
jgi:ATP phosphoribosyltransferase regulatory subunit